MKAPERVLLKWLKTPVGQLLQKEISQTLRHSFASMQGGYLLSLGLPDSGDILKDVQIPFKWSLTETLNEPIYYDGLTHFDALPFSDKLFDFIILAYPGFYGNQLDPLYAEIERVLAPDGHLLVFDLNRWSFLGCHFKRFVQQKGGSYHFHAAYQVSRAIKQNGLVVQEIQSSFYRYPWQSDWLLRKERFMETVSRLIPLVPAGFYAISAQKNVHSLIPIRERWRGRLDDEQELELIS